MSYNLDAFKLNITITTHSPFGSGGKIRTMWAAMGDPDTRHDTAAFCFEDLGWSGEEKGHLPCSGAAFYERNNGISLPRSWEDHHCQKLPTWLWNRGEVLMEMAACVAHVFVIHCSGPTLQVIELCRPSDSRLEHVDFECLFSSLSLRLLLRVFASLLLERRVIFTADKLRCVAAFFRRSSRSSALRATNMACVLFLTSLFFQLLLLTVTTAVDS